MVDKFLVLFSMALLIAFCAVVMYFVAEPDLIIIMTLVLVLAFYDFWVSALWPRKNDDK